ncbi:Heat-labile enterotoxin IIA, A chain, partial [Metarhizium majus ARSEF 297]
MDVWEWAKRRCAALRSTDEYLVRIRELAVNGLLNSCSMLEINPPNNEDVRTALEERCGAFETEVHLETAERGTKNTDDTDSSQHPWCHVVKRELHPNEAYQKELVTINCPPGSENEETQSAATPTSPEPTPEPPRQCFDSTGPIPRGGEQTTAELEMRRVVWSLRICLGPGGRQMQGQDRGGYLGARVVTTVVVVALRGRTSSIFMTVCCLFSTSVKARSLIQGNNSRIATSIWSRFVPLSAY